MISFIVPAYNEEAVLGATLAAIDAAGRGAGEPFEVVVADDASEDATAAVARAAGARVVKAGRRQIAAARNAGARAAQGDVFIFVDADTIVSPRIVHAALDTLRSGAIGGGAGIRFDSGVPLSIRALAAVFMRVMRLCRFAAGCFVFVRRDAFEAAGGFDERFYASEELHLSRALKRQGRFVILRDKVVTSGRKARLYSPLRLLWMTVRILGRGPRGLERREGLEMWYDGTLREQRREPAERD